MKLLLIRPNSLVKDITPPIGLGYLSYAVKHERGIETHIIDARRFRLSTEAVVRRAID